MSFDFKKNLASLSERELGRRIDIATKPVAASVSYRSSTAIDFTSRDVYQFSRHPKVIRAAQKALDTGGFSSLASRVSTGTDERHVNLESRLAKFTGTTSSLLFNTRNQAVLSLVSCLANERDLLIISSDIRAPFADAAYLVDCDVCIFNPEQPDSLHSALNAHAQKVNKFIVIDVVSEASGRRRDLPALFEVAAQFDAEVILDESLSFGTLGTRGAGAFDESPELSKLALCSLLDFSMLLGLKGAAIVGMAELVSLILGRSLALELETPPSLPAVAALQAAIDVLELAVTDRRKLLELGESLSQGLRAEGFECASTPIVPLVLLPFETFRLARDFQDGLFDKGVLGEVQVVGSGRRGECNLSLILTTAHSKKELGKTLESFATVKRRLRV